MSVTESLHSVELLETMEHDNLSAEAAPESLLNRFAAFQFVAFQGKWRHAHRN